MDKSSDIGYNQPSEYDEVVQRINLKKLVPIHDTKCKHDKLVPDYSDETEDYLAYKCANDKCGRGVLISKHD